MLVVFVLPPTTYNSYHFETQPPIFSKTRGSTVPPGAQPALSAKMPGYGTRARILAVNCYIEAKKDPAAAAELLAKCWPKGMGPLPRQPKEFIKRHAEKWARTGNVADAPRTGRPPKLTKAQAAKAAKVFGAGYTESVQRVRGEPPVEQRRGFGGIKDALRRSARLRAIKTRSGVSPKTLLRQVLRANPKIKKHPRDRKAAKSLMERQVRQSCAKEWLQRAKGGRWAWIKNLFFFDEGCIEVERGPKRRELEYFDEHSDSWRYTMAHPLVKVRGGIKLWFYIAVNAVAGPVCIYFTTGTTGLKRLYVGEFEDPPGGFEVGSRGCAWGSSRLKPNLLARVTAHHTCTQALQACG